MKKNLTLTDILIEEEKEKEIYFKNYLFYAKQIKKEAEKILGEVKVFVFGSILRQNEPKRDIDILIVSKNLDDFKKRREVRVRVWKKIGIFSPFEIHFATPDEYNGWYRYFLKRKKEV